MGVMSRFLLNKRKHKMKRTQEELQAHRAFNETLRQRFEAHFGEEAIVPMGTVKAMLLNECRKVIDATPFGEEMSLENAATMRMLTGWNYQRIRHMYNPKHFTDHRYIEVLQEDGTWITHSWRKTISPTTDWQDLQKAMRETVTEHALSEYRKTAVPICRQCGTTELLTVDHKSKSFDEIMQTFVAALGEAPAIKDGAMGQGRELADESVAKAWIAYHDSVADFQILCRSCNASKGKKSLQHVVDCV